MYALSRFWQSTIGKKIVMAVTGIIGILFVLGHMSGNFLMFKGQGAMHDYALLLRTSMPLLWAIRVGRRFASVQRRGCGPGLVVPRVLHSPWVVCSGRLTRISAERAVETSALKFWTDMHRLRTLAGSLGACCPRLLL